MRRVAVLTVLSVMLAACAPPDGPAGAPSPVPSASSTGSDAARVRAAVEATRAKSTARFVLKSRTVMPGSWMEIRRDGAYDLAAGRASVVQTVTSDPPDVLSQLTGKPMPKNALESHALLTPTGGYLQLPRWPAPAHAKWLRFAADDIAEVMQMPVDVETTVFPGAVAMLAQARRSAREGTDGAALAHVVVPASLAFLAFPSTTRNLVDLGVDPEKITGEIEVEVALQDGLVGGVWFDALPAFEQAYAQLGDVSELGDSLSELAATVALEAHGRPVTIELPPAEDVMTQAELQSYLR